MDAEAIPLEPDAPWFICVVCARQCTRRTAPDAVQFGDFSFCSRECERRWIFKRAT